MYQYNAFGQRTQKQRPNGPTVLYSVGQNGELLAETDAAGTPIAEYVYAYVPWFTSFDIFALNLVSRKGGAGQY